MKTPLFLTASLCSSTGSKLLGPRYGAGNHPRPNDNSVSKHPCTMLYGYTQPTRCPFRAGIVVIIAAPGSGCTIFHGHGFATQCGAPVPPQSPLLQCPFNRYRRISRGALWLDQAEKRPVRATENTMSMSNVASRSFLHNLVC